MKVFDKKIGDTTYYKYRINLPKQIVEKSNFLNKELTVFIEKDKLIIEKTKEMYNNPQELTHNERLLQKEFVKFIKKSRKNDVI